MFSQLNPSSSLLFLLCFFTLTFSAPTPSVAAQSLSAQCKSLLTNKKLTKKQSNRLMRQCLPIGSSAGVARGDFNGDGFADLAVGIPLEAMPINGRNTKAGAVTIIYGSETGLQGEASDGRPGSQLWFQGLTGMPANPAEKGPADKDLFGAALASGDFNGDGFSDLAIGIPEKDLKGIADTGAITVLYGSTTGLKTDGAQSWSLFDFPEIAETSATIVRAGERFGSALAWGDFDGDGFGDLAIGVPGKSFRSLDPSGGFVLLPDGNLLERAGAVLVLRGSRGGLTRTNYQFRTQPSEGYELQVFDSVVQWFTSDPESGDEFGASLTGGDFNKDGFTDLVIGVPKEDLVIRQGSNLVMAADAVAVNVIWNDLLRANDAGAVNVIYGSKTGLRSDRDGIQFWHRNNVNSLRQNLVYERPGTGDQFGLTLASGDFTGDGVQDLAIGVPFDDHEPDPTFPTIPTIVDAGSVNLIYGAMDIGLREFNNNDWSGDIHQSFWALVIDPSLEQTAEAGDYFGLALAAGDFNGDGRSDLAVGAPGKDLFGVTDAGVITVYMPDAFGISPFQMPDRQTWHMGNLGAGDRRLQSFARFGSSLSAWNFGRNFDGKRYTDLAIGVPNRTSTELGRSIINAGGVFTLYGSKIGLSDTKENPSQLWYQGGNGIPDLPEAGDMFGMGLY